MGAPDSVTRSNLAFAVVREIAQGKTTMRQLVNAVGMSQQYLHKQLQALEGMGIVSSKSVRPDVGRPIKKYGLNYPLLYRLASDLLYEHYFHSYPPRKGVPTEEEYKMFCTFWGVRDAPALPKVHSELLFKRLLRMEKIQEEMVWFLKHPKNPHKNLGEFLVGFYEGLVRFSRSPAKAAVPEEIRKVIEDIEASKLAYSAGGIPDNDFYVHEE